MDHGDTVLASNFTQILDGRLLGKADHAVIGGVNLEDHRRVRVARLVVIGGTCSVGGADSTQLSASLLHDVRNTEGTADFHQLTVGDENFLTLSERRN